VPFGGAGIHVRNSLPVQAGWQVKVSGGARMYVKNGVAYGEGYGAGLLLFGPGAPGTGTDDDGSIVVTGAGSKLEISGNQGVTAGAGVLFEEKCDLRVLDGAEMTVVRNCFAFLFFFKFFLQLDH
jgi:hypothetical protein